MTNTLETKVRFDGGETMQEADQYVSSCDGGGVNLHLYKIGSYTQCNTCKSQTKCISSAHCAGEQAEP